MRIAKQKICKHCHNTYTGRNKSFCGITCQQEHQRLNPDQYNPTQFNRPEHTCEICGKVFRNKPNDVKRRSVLGVFCSNECRTEYKKSLSLKQDRVCKVCGKVFKHLPSKIDTRRGIYCSNECKHEAHKKEIVTTCEECGSEFITVKWKIESGMSKFCSTECYFQSRNKPKKVICETCGKEFTKSNTKIKLSAHNYCSKKCYGASVLGTLKPLEMRKNVSLAKLAYYQKLRDNGLAGRIYDMYEWETIREKTRIKYPFCAICNSPNDLHVHHIVPYRASKSHDEGNLITLCSSCHIKVEKITNDLIIKLNDYNEAGNIIKNKLFQLRAIQLYNKKKTSVKCIEDY